MKLDKTDVQKLIKTESVNINKLGNSKGATVLFYKGSTFYVWKKEKTVFFQKKWFWSKKYMFLISELSL